MDTPLPLTGSSSPGFKAGIFPNSTWRYCQGLNLGPSACQIGALPLHMGPSCVSLDREFIVMKEMRRLISSFQPPGSCKWIRTPAIIYATHVVTSLIPILAHILFADFSKSKYPAPDTLQERLTLSAIYFPYLLIPLLLLITMLISPRYNQIEKKKKK